MPSKEPYAPKPQPDYDVTPFENAEEAWFWFLEAQAAKNDGARTAAGLGLYHRPCEPADILKVMDCLYRQRRLVMDHFLVLRHYGKRKMPPDPRRTKEMRAHKLWIEALDRMEPILVRKGIVRAKKLRLSRPNKFWAHGAVVYEGGHAV